MTPKRFLTLAFALCVPMLYTSQAAEPALVFPAVQWEKIKPEKVGLSSEKLEVLRAWLKTQKTTAMQVSIRGRVVFEYGDLSRVSKVASIRKSVLAML